MFEHATRRVDERRVPKKVTAESKVKNVLREAKIELSKTKEGKVVKYG